MPAYRFEALDAAGKAQNGLLEADNAKAARAQLRAQGMEIDENINPEPFRKLVDMPAIFLREKLDEDIVLQGGDVVYVHRAPVFYVFGEAQRPGSFRIERAMTVLQALATAGGPTARGSKDRLQLHRQQDDGRTTLLRPEMTDLVMPNDVLYVRESLF